MKYTLVVVALLISLCYSSIPIPTRPEGYLYKASPKKVIRIDVFEDLLCSACRAFDPVFKSFLDSYTVNGDAVTDYVEVYFHMFPLPYHNHAFFISRLAPYIYEKTQCGTAVAEFASWALDNQDRWLSGGVKDMTEPQILDDICTAFTDHFSEHGYTKSSCLSAIQDRKYELLTRTSWKFATYNRVNGTPTVHLNGVALDEPPFEVAAWAEFLKPYLPQH